MTLGRISPCNYVFPSLSCEFSHFSNSAALGQSWHKEHVITQGSAEVIQLINLFQSVRLPVDFQEATILMVTSGFRFSLSLNSEALACSSVSVDDLLKTRGRGGL